jgi:endonuclease III
LIKQFFDDRLKIPPNIVMAKKLSKKQRVDGILNVLKTLYENADTELNFSKDYELLFAVILSAQTTDKQVNKVTEVLFEYYPTLESIAQADIIEFKSFISSISFYNNKAKNIIASANLLLNNFNSVVPKTIKELTTLPGAARKTANVVLSELYGINEGIAVDTHVARTSQRLRLTKHTDPIKIEKDLMKLFPQKDWKTVHLGLVLYGRHHWPAHKKVHDGPLAEFQ